MHCLGTLCKQLKLGHNKSFKLHSTYIQFNYKMQLSRWVNNRTFLDGKLAKMHTWSNFFMHSSYFSMYYVLGRKIVIINLMLACLHALGADRVFTRLVTKAKSGPGSTRPAWDLKMPWLDWLDTSLFLTQNWKIFWDKWENLHNRWFLGDINMVEKSKLIFVEITMVPK